MNCRLVANISTPHRVLCQALSALAVCSLLTGCVSSLSGTQSSGAAAKPAVITGRVHGGQQPVSGSAVYLFAATINGYGATSVSLLNTTAPGIVTDSSGNGYATTDSGGNFSMTGDYTCPSGALVYALAVGGNPGLSAGSTNPNLSMMTALGPCSSLTSSTFIAINELTTVASVYALSPFMSGPTAVGTSSSNIAGLTSAFAAVNELVSTSSGALPGPSLPSGAVLPVAAMNTIADALAACINSSGGVSGDGTSCGTLFASTIGFPFSGNADTVSATLFIAQNPGINVAATFAVVTSAPPFQPTLPSVPMDWALAIQYNPTGLSTPKALAIDASGNVWIANCGSVTCTTSGVGSVTELANTGALLGTTSAGGLNIPYALAIDLSGNAWVANYGGNSVTELNASLVPTAPAFTGSGLSQPNSIAIDIYGNAWLTNTNSNVLSEFSSAGIAQSPTTVTGVTAPVAIAINPH
jgi:hypothetical protein